MQKLLLLTLLFAINLTLGAQMDVNNGEILFETDFRQSDLESPIPAGFSITGINLRILSTANLMGLDIGMPGTYPTITMNAPPGPRTEGFYQYDDNAYWTIFQPNGTSGGAEIRWYFEAVISDGTTTMTIRENLADNVVSAGELDIQGCAIFPLAGTHVRRYFMNGNQNRALRSRLGSCFLVGDQELVLTLDARSSDVQPINNMAFVPARTRAMAWNSSPRFNLADNGDGTFSGRFAMGNPEFLVYSYDRNFGVTEATTMAGIVPAVCNLFAFGSRSYFQGAGAPNTKSNTDLWSSFTPDVGGTIVQPFAASTTVTSNASVTLADGYTYYLNGTYKLIAIAWGSETPAAPGDVSVSFGGNQATAYNGGTGFITNPAGAAIMGRTWDVANTTISSPVDVRFFFTTNDITAVNNLLPSPITADQFQFFKVTVPGGDPQDIPSLGVNDVIVYSEGGVAPNTEASAFTLNSDCAPLNSVTFSVSSFSGGGGGGVSMGGNFLPVELTALSASTNKNNVTVAWATASETDNAGFEVQHSTSGQLFRPLGTVSAAGNAAGFDDYAFEHNDAPLGINFYRLKQLDLDGGFSYSQVVTARVEETNGLPNVYPNPATNELFVTTAGIGEIELRDAHGQLISTSTVREAQQQINVQELKSGLYFVVIRNGDTATTQRFVKR